MRNAKWCRLVAALMSACLTACSHLYEGTYDYSDGWRRAIVVRMADDAQRTDDVIPDYCPVPGLTPADKHWAVVTYRVLKGHRTRLVRIAEHAALQAGDMVYINIHDAHTAVIPAAPGHHDN